MQIQREPLNISPLPLSRYFPEQLLKGGVTPDVVFDLSDVLLQRVENLQTIDELYQLFYDAVVLFAKLVCDSKRKICSYKIERCKMYVAENIYNKISVAEIAKYVDLSPNYLSKTFKQEEGVGLNDYIQKEKVKIGNLLLSHTTQTVSSISNFLSFASQSNFIDV